MGWEVADKRTFYPGSVLMKCLSQAVVIVDMAEAIRKTLPPKCIMTPFDLLSFILWKDLHKHSFKTVVVCFDSPDLMPKVRTQVLYKERYKTDVFAGEKPGKKWSQLYQRYFSVDTFPVSDEIAAKTTPHYLSAPWSRLMSSPKGKYYAFKAIEDSVVEIVTKANPLAIQYIVDRQDGTQFTLPPMDIPHFCYGEGDQKVVHYAMYLKDLTPERILIRSGDYDVLMSLMGYNHSKIDILINRAFIDASDDRVKFPYDKHTCELTRKKATEKWKDVKTINEIVNTEVIQAQSRTWRMNNVLFALCAGGADYCKHGTRRFGFTEKPMRILASQGIRCIAFAYDPTDPTNRIVRFYPKVFVRALARCKRSTKHNDNIEEFSSCIHFILFNLRYYFGCDSNHAPGGPEPPDTTYNLFPGVTSVSKMLKNPDLIKTAHIDFFEMFPVTSLSCTPETLFSGDQLEHVKICFQAEQP